MAENTIGSMASSQPKKQRKWYYTKPLHSSYKEFSVHLSKELRKDLGRRSLEVRKGDTVKVLRGGEKVNGKQGKVTGITRAKRMVFVYGVVKEQAKSATIRNRKQYRAASFDWFR